MEEEKTEKGLGLFALVGIIVGACIGSGVFALTGQLGAVSSPGATLIAWLVSAIGFLALALSLVNLSRKRPELSGIFQYATEGFGSVAGFISGWGYWLSTWLGSVAIATMVAQTLGYFFPMFLPGNNIPCVILESVLLWGITLLVLQGIENASFLNAIVMVAKMVALAVFVGFCIFLFKFDVFSNDFWGTFHDNIVAVTNEGVALGSIPKQISNCMIIMMWGFIGIEGATVMSSRAEKKSDVGKATFIGLAVLLIVYVSVSLLPYGYLPYSEIAMLDYPAVLYVFEMMAPGWGGAFIAVSIIAAIFGSWLSFTILPVETSSEMANQKLLGARWGQLNKHNAPQFSLIVVGFCIQALLIVDMFISNAYNFAISFATVTIVFSWGLCSLYQIKYSREHQDWMQCAIGVLATVFLLFGTVIGGWKYILLACVGYVPGFYFYIKTRKEEGHSIGTPEKVVMGIFSAAAAVCIVLLITGVIAV